MVVSLASHHSRFGTAASRMIHWVDQVLSPGDSKCYAQSAWTPSINLYEDSACYYMVVDLAGVDAEQMDLRVEKDTLILAGRREPPQPAEPAGEVCLHLMEIDHDRFCRTLKLPADVAGAAIEASYRNGLLWVRIPKKA